MTKLFSLSERLKEGLTVVGAHSRESMIRRLDSCVDYLWVGRWMRTKGLRVSRRVTSRFELFDMVLPGAENGRFLYLEFGVFEGRTLQYWSSRLGNPLAMLHGFDSFEGLPEAWNTQTGKGHFSTGGVLPTFEDTRVKLFKGLFEDTLPSYEAPDHDRLFLNMDADLYSSTATVLSHLEPVIAPGSYLYFDEFKDRDHELRAFDEFLARTGMKFRVVGATLSLSQVLFERL